MKEYTKALTLSLIISLFLTLLTLTNAMTLPQKIYLSKKTTSLQNFPYSTLINVSQYSGANDSERIQKALNDVPSEGGIVIIPEGTWIACNLKPKSKTIIMGTKETVIKRPNNTIEPFIIFQNISEFRIINITFDGQSYPSATGILVIDSNNFQIANNTFINIERNAIRIIGNSRNFTVEHNTFINCNEATICLFGSPGTREIKNFTIAYNILLNGTRNGKIGLAFVEKGLVISNIIKNGQYGIGTRCISNIIIESNIIENCSSYGIYLGTQPGDQGSNNIQIKNNYIKNCSIGISRYYGSYPVTNVTVENNYFLYNKLLDCQVNFPGNFINNTLTSDNKLCILDPGAIFRGNKAIDGKPIIPADINNDLKVDMKDIGITAIIFGTSEGMENWNPKSDVIKDHVIDMKDIAFIISHYGIAYH